MSNPPNPITPAPLKIDDKDIHNGPGDQITAENQKAYQEQMDRIASIRPDPAPPSIPTRPFGSIPLTNVRKG